MTLNAASLCRDQSDIPFVRDMMMKVRWPSPWRLNLSVVVISLLALTGQAQQPPNADSADSAVIPFQIHIDDSVLDAVAYLGE